MNQLKTSIAAATVLSLLLSGCSADVLVTYADESPANTDQQAETEELAEQPSNEVLYQQVFEHLHNGDLKEVDFLLDDILIAAGDSPEAYKAHVLRGMLYGAKAQAYYRMLRYLDQGVQKEKPTEEEINKVAEIYALIQDEHYAEQSMLVESIRFVMDHEDLEVEFPIIFLPKSGNAAELEFQKFATGEGRMPDAASFDVFIREKADEWFSTAAARNFTSKKLKLTYFLFDAQGSLRAEHNDLSIQMLNKVLELEANDPYSPLRRRVEERLALLKTEQARTNSL